MKKQRDMGNVLSSNCPSRLILGHLTGKWSILVLLALSDGEIKRYGELKRKIEGVSEKMLIQTLRLLEDDGIIKRKSYEEIPPVVEYSLTKLGMEVSKEVLGLTSWIESNYSRFKIET